MLRVNLIRSHGVRPVHVYNYAGHVVIPGNESRNVTKLTIRWSNSSWYATRKVQDVEYCEDN